MAERCQSTWRRLLACALGLLMAATAAAAAAADPGSVAAEQQAESPPPRVLHVFVREGCPHCRDAKLFLEQLSVRRPQLRIELHPVDEDAAAARRLQELSQRAGIWPPGVPTFEIEGRVLVGFDDAEHAGRAILALVDEGRLAPPSAAVELPLLGTLDASRVGLPLFTLSLGLLDGFNPCAMWVLLFLLSLLVRLRDRRRLVLVAGSFVLASAAVYYAFMAAWLNVFLAVGLGTPVRIALALLALLVGALNVKDFFALGQGLSLSIPASARPWLVARMERLRSADIGLPASLLGVVALALIVNLVELLCTAGLPAVYTAVLSQQGLSWGAYHAYLGLYVLGYMADDSLMVATAVVALGSGKLTERAGRLLKLLSGLVMLTLGALLLFRPQWLW